ncbi:MAG: hypothetical protein WBM08_14485 [Prochlorococcaceae cyanobacterium]
MNRLRPRVWRSPAVQGRIAHEDGDIPAFARGPQSRRNRARTPTQRSSRRRVHGLVGLSACLMVLAAGPDPLARRQAIQLQVTENGTSGP